MLGTEIVTGIDNVCVKPVAVAVTETVYFPAAVVKGVPIVKLVEDPAVRAVVICGVIPLGAETESASGVVKLPWKEAQESATVVDWPATSETAEGLAARVQEGGTAIISETVAIWVTPPPEAVINSG